MTKYPSPQDAEALAVVGFEFLGEDLERLDRFMALTGLTLATLRQAAAAPGFLAGVLDHFSSDERLLTEFAAYAGVSPERVEAARHVLAPPGIQDDG